MNASRTVGDAPASTSAGFPVDTRLCLAVHTAARAMDAVYRPLLEGVRLTYPQFLVMSVLWEDGEQGVGQLAQRLALDASTLSPLLKRLEARGLLRRERIHDDQRRVTVTLTDDGIDLRRQVRGVPDAVCDATGLGGDQQTRLVAQLHDLAARLHDSGDPD